MAQEPVVVGISGGSAAGKTTFTNSVAEKLNAFDPVVINQDHYFRDWSVLPESEREAARTANHPRAVLWEPLVDHIARLREGLAIELPPPGTRAFARKDERREVVAKKLVIVEGHLLFWEDSLRPLLDLKIFLDVNTHERVLRRMLRDTGNNRSLEEAVAWYRRDVIPNYETYTAPTRQYADLIVPYEGEVDVAVEVAVNGVRAMVEAKVDA